MYSHSRKFAAFQLLIISVLLVGCTKKVSVSELATKEKDGTLLTYYNESLFTGIGLEYYDSEQKEIKEQITYHEGLKNGEAISYYKGGVLHTKGNYADGNKTGVWTDFTSEGNKIWISNWENGYKNGTSYGLNYLGDTVYSEVFINDTSNTQAWVDEEETKVMTAYIKEYEKLDSGRYILKIKTNTDNEYKAEWHYYSADKNSYSHQNVLLSENGFDDLDSLFEYLKKKFLWFEMKYDKTHYLSKEYVNENGDVSYSMIKQIDVLRDKKQESTEHAYKKLVIAKRLRELGYGGRSSNSRSYGGNSYNSTFYFTNNTDVVTYLAGKTFVWNNLSMKFQTYGCVVNSGQAQYQYADYVAYSSTRGSVKLRNTSMYNPNGTLTLYVNTANNTISDGETTLSLRGY